MYDYSRSLPPVSRRTAFKISAVGGITVAAASCAGGSDESDEGATSVSAGESVASLFDPLKPPTQLASRVSEAGSVVLIWATGSMSGGEPRYAVRVDGIDVAEVAGNTTTVVVASPMERHTFDVRSVDGRGVSSAPTATIVRTAVPPTAQVPPVLIAEPAAGSVQFRWDHPGDGGSAPAFEYRLFRDGSSAPLAVLSTDRSSGSAPATDFYATGVIPYVVNEYYLVAYDDVGAALGEASNRVRVAAFRRAWPEVPLSMDALSGLAVRDGRVLVWTTSGDDVAYVLVFVDGLFSTKIQGDAGSVDVADLREGRRATVVAVHPTGVTSDASAAVDLPPVARVVDSGASRFTTNASAILDPAGSPFIPVGANLSGMDFIWFEDVLGQADAAADNWRWNCVRIGCGMSDWGAISGGYLYFRNNDLRAIVEQYTGRGIVVMLTQFSKGSGSSGSSSTTLDAPNSAPDGTGRSIETALVDWWVEVATMFADNPYVWINPINEPAGNLDELEETYRRIIPRIRGVAPSMPLVLDAANFANDIPNDATIGSGPVDPEQSFVLSRGQDLVAEFGEPRGFGPVLFSIHVYSRWPVDYDTRGRVDDAALADRMRAFAREAKARNVAFLVGETGVEDWAREYDSASVRVGLYEQGVRDDRTLGVWQEQGIGVLAWHASPSSGMPLAAGDTSWADVTDAAGTSPPPDAGLGLWNYARSK